MAEPQRQLHIRVPVKLHRALRVRAAAEDKTVQELVVEILSNEIDGKLEDEIPAKGGSHDE